MKKILLTIIMLISISGFMLIPDRPISAYPPTTPLPPTVDAPIIASYDCEPVSQAQIVWYDPTPGIGSFSYTNPGLLYVFGQGNYVSLVYDGFFIDPFNKIIHEWHANYLKPSQQYYLQGYVRTITGVYYWIYPNMTYIDCDNYLYLPYITK